MSVPNPLDDELLALAAVQGGQGAIDELFDRWYERLWRHAWRLTGDEQSASDVTQEAWVVIARTVHRLNEPAAFPAWAYRITSNKARDWIRREQRRRRSEEGYATLSPNETSRSEDECVASLRDALRSLAGEDRAILSLYYEDHLTTREIAKVLGIPRGTVKSRLHAARGRLRRFFQEEDEDDRP